MVHCPPRTAHAFIGAGDGPCVISMAGARHEDRRIVYPELDRARSNGAGVDKQTSSPAEAYAAFPHWQPGPPGAGFA